jgi:hypothetical protein
MGLKLMLSTSLAIFLCHSVTTRQTMDTKVYNTIPIQIRERASVAFIGTFFTGRGLCEIYDVGKSRWRLIKGFEVSNDLIGDIKAKRIEVYPSLVTDPLRKNVMEHDLLDGAKYCILLKPESEKLSYITDDSISFNYHDHIVTLEEIVLIIKLE